MVSADNEHQPRQNEPNWVGKWTLYILAGTLIAVGFYCWQAFVANCLTRKVLDSNTRPYIGTAIYGPSEIPPFSPANDRSMTIPISYLHFGKLPGDALIRRTVALSTTQLDAGPDIESVTPVHKFIWPAGSISEYKFGITAIGLNIVWSTKSWLALLVPALLNGQFRY